MDPDHSEISVIQGSTCWIDSR